MGTRFLFNTKTNIGNNTIQLKHKGIWLGNRNAKKITLMIARARAMLSSTIAAISCGTVDQALAGTYFVGTPSATEWLELTSRMELTYGGLNSDVTLKLGADGAHGYVMASVVSATTPGAVVDKDGDHVSRAGHTMHVSKKSLLGSEEIGVVTIIHEASHKYANTFDYGWSGYRKSNDSDWEEPGLTHAEAVNNADSLAYFVYRQGAGMGA